MDFEKNDAAIGAFVLAALAVFLLTVLAVNRERLTSRTYHLQIQLPNIAGIDKGVEVIYQGYKAGAVDRVTIAYEPEFRFIVRLAIKEEIQLKMGTNVIVRSKGFGGARYLELSPPSAAENRPIVPDGAMLPTLREADLMSKAHDVMGELQKVVRNFQREGTGDEIVRIVKRSDSALAGLERALSNINALMEENRAALKAALQQTQGLTTRANDLMSRKDQALQQTVDHLRESVSHLPAIMMNLEELTAELKRHPWRMVRKGEPGGAAPRLEHKHAPAVLPSTATPSGPN